jgi:hypothetical protein
MTQGTDITGTRDEATLTLHGSSLRPQDAWWNDEADVVEGYDLVKDKALFALVGVPFRIFTLTFRAGIQQKGCEWRNDYVTAELRVAPGPVIARQIDRILSRRTGKLITDTNAIADPGEQLVVNDGSTGFYRQCVQYLEAKELITLPDTLPKEGAKNECRYDLPASTFTISDYAVRHDQAEIRFGPDGDQVTIFRVRLDCLRGLRYSDYENAFTDADGAITWYIA